MGTNFYVRKNARYSDHPDVHIGKRSAAGLYCWDCKRTLCKGGESQVHMGSGFLNHDKEWFSACPVCGKSYEKEGIEHSSAGRELGFNKSTPAPKTGVKSCSSFSWAMPESEWRGKCRFVWDEYGRRFTKAEFEQILEECPIRFTDSIGQYFS